MKTVVRLDKYLADMGVGTRSAVKEKIRRGLVTVNGKAADGPEMKVDTTADEIWCDGRAVSYVHYEYYMLHKPAGVISATEDRRVKTVVDLIDSRRRRDLFPVGRLDKDTEGLLLITNDGALCHQLLSPKKHVSKLYYARVSGCVGEADVKAFAAGLVVDEALTALPARLTVLSASESISEILLEIYEGKFHQVKRMFEAVGKEVVYLKRFTMGSLHLDPSLAPGAYRELTKAELEALRGENAGKPDAKKLSVGQPASTAQAASGHVADPLSDVRLPDGTAQAAIGHAAAAQLSDGRPPLLAGIGAVIFDLDGTLVDSMWVWKDIDIEYLGRFGFELPEDLQDAIAGISVTQTALYFQERFGIQDSVEKIIGDWNDMAWDKYTHEVPLKGGALEFLKLLKFHHIPCAIATSNSRDLTQAVLKSHGIEGYFDEILTGEDIHKGKPDPDVYLEAARRLKVSPQKCLVFEDIPYGIMAAKAAGMACAAVEDAFSAVDGEQKRSLGDYYINDYFDIFDGSYEELSQ